MAKNRRSSSQKMGKYIKGRIDFDLPLGTLSGNTLIGALVADAVAERTLVSSIVCRYALQGFTVTDNAGPVRCGVAHSDYTDAEVEAWLELTTGWSEADRVAQEVSNRLCREIGVFPGPPGGGLETAVINDGKPVKTKLNWILNVGQNLRFWAYNSGNQAFVTSDPNFHVSGHANLWPR